MTNAKRIDNKHSVAIDDNGFPIVAKRLASGEMIAIPADEPIILFRGRDRLALPMLRYYMNLCEADGATPYQLESMEGMIQEFREFASHSPTMKQPGITMGK